MKTQVKADDQTAQIHITREFDLPIELLFKAYTDASLFEQWMGTKVIKFDIVPHGGYRFETCDNDGNVLFSANGTIHEVLHNERITRTFETCLPAGKVENSSFPVQLEFLEFESISTNTSKLKMQILFRSIEFRNQLMQMPFAQGLNHAHNQLQEIINHLK